VDPADIAGFLIRGIRYIALLVRRRKGPKGRNRGALEGFGRGQMRHAWYGIVFASMTVALGGCALPPAISLASTSADAVSYIETGKSLTDRAYSWVARSDCAFMRVLRGAPICFNDLQEEQDEKQLAAASATAPAATPTASASANAAPAVSAPASPAPRMAYVAIGSFVDRANAERSAARYAPFHPVITTVVVKGRQFNRVIAGPLTPDDATALKGRLLADAGSGKRA
jgi:hypothetical protein